MDGVIIGFASRNIGNHLLGDIMTRLGGESQCPWQLQ
jgi:hypothetical protein